MLLSVYLKAWYDRMRMKSLQDECIARRKAAMGAQSSSEDIPIPKGQIILMDTDVESSTALWEWNASIMSQSLLLHDEVLRSCLAKHNGVELLTEGDAFLVYFTRACDAVGWGLSVQEDLMTVNWPPALLDSGLTSSALVSVQGTRIFNGLRVRMGGHIGEAGVDTANSLSTTKLLKTTREVSDFAMGGQILFSNDLFSMVKDTPLPKGTDIAAVGSIQDVNIPEEVESVTKDKDAPVSVVQILPASLRRRLPEFIPMYIGREDQIRAPSGKVCCVFTHCSDIKRVAKTDSDLASVVSEMVDRILEDLVIDMQGYQCKGQGGKFFIVFNTTEEALQWCVAVQRKLLETSWPKGISTALCRTEETILKGMTVGIGVHTGAPTMFNFNRVTNKMDYFGQVVNRTARYMAKSIGGEICISSVCKEDIPSEYASNLRFSSRGLHTLKGVTEPQEVISVQPPELESRFALLEKIRADQEGEGVTSASLSSPGLQTPSAE